MGKRKFKTEGASPKEDKTEQGEVNDENELQPQNDVLEKPSQKRLKTSKFDIKHFRKDLAIKNGQTTVLTQFLQACLDPDADMDYLLEYLNAGGNSHEILRQVTLDSKKNLTLATPAFHIFHLIILKVQSLFPQMISITEEACRYFLNNFMSTVEIMISENSGPRHKKIILKLFTSMVTLNPDLGIEILNQAPLTPKHLQHILEKPNYKEKDNVRTAFVHFMTSFLVDGHLPLIKALLEKQGLLSLVIPGLIQDEPEPVLMFLNILKKNIIENLFISKSLKLKTFNNNVLQQIFRLFYWKGPPETNHDVINEFKPEIISLLSEVILILFTNSKFGLYFTDPSLGTTDANKNQNLYKAILSLKRPWENEHQCEILLEIIYKCPDLHRSVVNLIDQNFEPQHSPIWEKTVDFVLKLYEKFKPESMVQRFSKLKPQQVANFIRFATLPVPMLKHLTTALGKTDTVLSMHSIKVIVKMLSSLKRYIQILEIDDSNEFEVELKNKLEYFFPKHLPVPSVIVNLIQKTINEEPPTQVQSQEYQIARIDKVESLILLIDLLLLYHDIHPAHFENLEGILNMKDILDYSMSVTDGRVALLKFKVVSLWILLDSSAVSLQNSMFKDLFQILLDVYTSDDDITWMEAKDTVYNFFKSTNIFEANDDEIHIMLYALRNCNVDSEAIGEAVKYVLENNQSLTENVREEMAKLDVANAQSEINIEKLLDDLSAGKNIERSMGIETKTPSTFIVGCRQYIKNNKSSKKKLKHFVSIYIANLLHTNISPNIIEMFTSDDDHSIPSYVGTWKTEPALLSDKEVGKDETLINISKYVLNEEQINLHDFISFVRLVSEDDYEFKFMDSYYKYDNVDIDKSAILVWTNYLIFSVIRLAELESLDQTKVDRIKEILNVIINFCNKQHMTDISRSIILFTLKNPQFVKIYSPVEHKIESYALATAFLIDIITTYNDITEHLNKKYNVLKNYQQKNYSEITKALSKIKKKRNMNTENVIKGLKVIGLKFSDDKRIMNQIKELDVLNFAKDDKEPSFALEVLTSMLTKYSKITVVAEKQLTQIMTIYTKLLTNKDVTVNLTNIEQELIEFLENKPHQVKSVTEDIFKQFFHASTIRKTTTQLATLILKSHPKFCLIFISELDRPEILSQREITLPLGEAMLNHQAFVSQHIHILHKIYEEYKSNIFKVIEKPHKAGQVYVRSWQFVRKLLIECTTIEDCEKVFSKIHKFEVVELSHIHLINAMFKKLCLNPDKLKPDYVNHYFLCILNLIALSVKESKSDQDLNVVLQETYVIYKVIQYINKDKVVDYKKVTDTGIWQGFCKTVLKDALKMKTEDDPNNPGPALLFTLSKLLQLFYTNEHEELTTLFEMATSHSEFLKVMLSHNSPEIKTRLLEFLFTIIQKNPSVMKQQHIPVYLSAYRATKSPCDRLILSILQFYETSNLPVQEYKPYLWGDSAANYYAVRKNKTASLWSQPTPHQIMNLFDKETLQHTLQQFDINQKLDYNIAIPAIDDKVDAKAIAVMLESDGVFTKQKAKDTEVLINELVLKSKYDPMIQELKASDQTVVSHKDLDSEVYDAAFVLPLLSHMLAPGAVASCFKLLRKGLLSVPVMALSSTCPRMRAAAYHVLHRFAMLLETESKHKNDKLLLTDFIDTLRSSLKSAIINSEDTFDNLKNPRLPAIDALYLAKALIVSTAPFEPVYKPVNNFLIAKEQIDLSVVPDFLSLFHDCDVESADRRNWILNVIRYGTKSMIDVNVVFKTMCIKMIMDFYSSVLCDRKGKEKILNVLDSIVSVPRASEILIEGYGIMSWLHGVICLLKPEDRTLFKPLVQILKTLLQSMQINGLTKILNASKKTNKSVIDFSELNMNRVDKELESEIVNLLSSMISFAEFIEVDDVIFYLNTFNLVSKKSVKVLSRKGLLNIIQKCAVFCKNADVCDLLCAADNYNSYDGLNSKVIKLSLNTDEQSGEVLKELLKLVRSTVT